MHDWIYTIGSVNQVGLFTYLKIYKIELQLKCQTKNTPYKFINFAFIFSCQINIILIEKKLKALRQMSTETEIHDFSPCRQSRLYLYRHSKNNTRAVKSR